jgi:hypothetical protein
MALPNAILEAVAQAVSSMAAMPHLGVLAKAAGEAAIASGCTSSCHLVLLHCPEHHDVTLIHCVGRQEPADDDPSENFGLFDQIRVGGRDAFQQAVSAWIRGTVHT